MITGKENNTKRHTEVQNIDPEEFSIVVFIVVMNAFMDLLRFRITVYVILDHEL